MLQGKCEKCGKRYSGWLLSAGEQLCSCGGVIEVVEPGELFEQRLDPDHYIET